MIPHAPPFRFIDRILSSDGDGAVCETLVPPDFPALLLVECMAQTCAAAEGTGRPGVLGSLRDVRIARAAASGERLRIEARRAGALGDAVLFQARVLADGEEIATGRLAFVLL